jgi:chorismate lyase / 3-hydroxybenzoate synthase
LQPSDDGIARARRGLDGGPAAPDRPRSLSWRGLRPSFASAPDEGSTLLAIAHEGGLDVAAGAPLVVRVPLAQLDGAPLAELWQVDQPLRSGSTRGLRWAATDGLLAGALELPAPDGASLEAAACFAYRELLAVSAELGYPHLLRVWNVVPAINRLDGGLERYRRFCRGRAEAFEGHHGPLFQSRLCASSAVGSATGDLVVWFLAAKHRGLPRENPRQVSAYSYPPCYGPRSPSFARATRCPAPAGGWLLLSGTASIVGHRSLHRGDARRQLAETLDNLEQLAGARGSAAAAAPFRALKVYVRHPEDLPVIRAELEARLGEALPVLYLQADICREELLLEIEGVA